MSGATAPRRTRGESGSKALWLQDPGDTDPASQLTVRCFNVKYSPNLGDGLLSECLERAIVDWGADPRTSSIDLAARTSYGQTMPGRVTAMTMLDALSPRLRRVMVRVPLAVNARRKWRPHFAAGLNGADAVVLGGGNLISDFDLNFPTKLPLAVEEAERRRLPVAIYACGVGHQWSTTGLSRLRKAFSSPQLRAIFVRDADSKAVWDELMGAATGHLAVVVRDPGLMASRLYPAPVRRSRTDRRPIAGLGIISPIALRYHAENAPLAHALGHFFVETARRLIAEGFVVRVFTNGSPEDVAYASTLRDRLAALGDETRIAFLQQHDPKGLCHHIARFDVLIAHRMHAVIAAYSYGVPVIALAWDRKLRSFMASVGRDSDLLEIDDGGASECALRVLETIESPIAEDERQTVIAEAHMDVGKLWRVLDPGGRS